MRRIRFTDATDWTFNRNSRFHFRSLPLKYDLQWQSHGGIREVKDPDTAPQETSASFALPPRFDLCIKERCQWIAR